ncbi:hypothetical protein COV82_04105 [Candidatus Peregrinibacteria bacterium CG11_big_fil_rev_8_21_14_0_20_46_8]|nr:MAG: hypothetical protein COV82_04105 [Candidatus Peregrinibacteria bacterium CG11_big_fil_rev_8_21_14_0_20_46_8]
MKKTYTSAFTLIELIIYVTILSLFVGALSNFYINIRHSTVRTDVASEIQHSAHLALHRITQDVRAADTLVTATGNTLAVSTLGTTTTFTTIERTVTIGGEDVTITVLQRTVGAGTPEDLTSNNISVTNFTVENRTRGSERPNVKILLTIEYENPGTDINRNRSLSLETAISLRSEPL